ncbi:MAG: DUF86 domain-containing protein [Candidatus Fermentibacteraceae bacterium]|nr:DUF86 domain-containing protein [Candidatus Fermentibacteraceae bacterium]
MYDRKLVNHLLGQVIDAIEKIERRFKPVTEIVDFTDTPEGIDRLDSICMTLIAVGESLKNLDKITDRTLLNRHPEIDWKGAMGLRDIISHHYFDIDAEEIFWVCNHQLKPLKRAIKKMLQEESNTVGN